MEYTIEDYVILYGIDTAELVIVDDKSDVLYFE